MNEFESADLWLAHNAEVIPSELLPIEGKRQAFVNMLVSFGMTSRDANRIDTSHVSIGSGGLSTRRGDSNHCRCRFCADMVWKLGDRSWEYKQCADKQGARLLKLTALREIVSDAMLPLLECELEPIAGRPGPMGRDLAIWAYGRELVRRCNFDQNRLAYLHLKRGVLRLWRQVALNHQGIIPQDFRLDARCLLTARDRLLIALKKMVARELQ